MPVNSHERIAKLLKNEVVLTVEQQKHIAQVAGADIFKRASVPNAPVVSVPSITNNYLNNHTTSVIQRAREIAIDFEQLNKLQRLAGVDILRRIGLFNPQSPLPFARGGTVPGINRGYDSVLTLLTPGEVIMNLRQQTELQRIAGADILRRIGIPNAPAPVPPIHQPIHYNIGGTAPSVAYAPRYAEPAVSERQSDSSPVNVYFDEIVLEVGERDATRLYVRGGRTDDGRRVTIKNIKDAKRNGEL